MTFTQTREPEFEDVGGIQVPAPLQTRPIAYFVDGALVNRSEYEDLLNKYVFGAFAIEPAAVGLAVFQEKGSK